MKPAAAVKKSPGAASVAWDPSSFGQSMASIVAVLSFGLVCMALGGLFSHVDTRLILTASENFAGLAEIRDIFKQTLNLTVAVNPAGVDHVPYPTVPETYVEVEDLHKRGLMDAATFASFKPLNSTYDVSLLRQLLRASWCSGMPWITGSLPARRTPGCQCIADAYLDFVGSSLAESPGNNGVIYPSAGLRERVSSRVYRCWDLRQVRRSRTCGNVCKTHVVGLALFADIVLFLTSAAFLVFYSASLRERYGMVSLKLIVALLAGVASIPFFVRYPEANSINVAAVVVCVLYLVVGLHEELDMLGMQDALNVLYQKTLADGRPIPNPFMVCVLVTLPLVLSSHTIQLGVSGYARDVWALFSFGLCGGLLGLLLQRYFWMCFYGNQEQSVVARMGRTALLAGYVCVQILLILLFVAYRYDGGPYLGGDLYVFIMYQGFLTALAAILGYDHGDRMGRTNVLEKFSPGLSALQGWFILMVLGANGGLTVVAFLDVINHPS